MTTVVNMRRMGPLACLMIVLVLQIGHNQRLQVRKDDVLESVSTRRMNAEPVATTDSAVTIDEKEDGQSSQPLETLPKKKKDDIHHSSTGVLELQDWEIATLQKPYSDSCNPPDGVHKICCLGTPDASKVIKKKFQEARTLCDHLTLEDYQWQQQQAQRELSALDKDDQCDACGIVDLLQKHNLTFAFFGDSVSRQTVNALACELERRHYQVDFEEVPIEPRGDGYRNFKEIKRLVIQSPTWNHNTPVTLELVFQYRLPFLNPEEQQAIASNYDVLIVNFGQHWVLQPDPKDTWERDRYNRDTLPGQLKDFFNALHLSNKIQLLAWRENTASHFDGDGGDFSLARLKPGFQTGDSSCVASYDHTAGRSVTAWRETAFREAIQRSEYNGVVVTAGQHMPPVSENPEVVVLPFYDFSSKSHAFHKRTNGAGPDCLHFCYSPFLYLPIWRGIRLAMERSFEGSLSSVD